MDAAHHAMRFVVDYRVMLVDRLTGSETRRLPEVVDGGSIERSQDTQIMETGSLDYAGTLDLRDAVLRIWADVTYEDGASESIALGTFVTDGPQREVTGGTVDTTPLNLYGRLRALSGSQFPYPVTLEAGANPLDAVDGWIRDAGLELAAHDETDYRLGSTWTFGVDDTAESSVLTAINDLLDLIGWQAARTDPMGRVVLARYVRPADRAPSWTFREGPDARFVRSMTDERDWFDTVNQVITVYSDDDRDFRGVAVDDDPDSPFSTVNRGFVNSATYSYSDIPEGMSDADAQVMADDKAAELLATAQAVVRKVTFTHVYAPVTIGDVVTIDYPSGGVQDNLAIRAQKISLTAGLPIEAEARSFSR